MIPELFNRGNMNFKPITANRAFTFTRIILLTFLVTACGAESKSGTPPEQDDSTTETVELPVEEPPVEEPPVEEPPVEEPPVEEPPVEEPPVEEPPVEDPPVEDPPVEDPPVEDPPVEEPPVEEPPVEEPPVEEPPVEEPPAELSPIEKALIGGDVSFIDHPKTLVIAINDRVEINLEAQQDFINKIYEQGEIEYNGGRQSQFFYALNLKAVMPLIMGEKGFMLAAASEIDGRRNAAFGANILSQFSKGKFPTYQPYMKNVLGWLLKQDQESLQSPKEVKLLGFSADNATAGKDWLSEQFPEWKIDLCESSSESNACTDAADLAIISGKSWESENALKSVMDKLQENKVSLLYAHGNDRNVGALTPVLLNSMGLYMEPSGGLGNYNVQDKADWESTSDMLSQSDLLKLNTLVNNLHNDTFDFDLSKCNQNCETMLNSDTSFTAGAKMIQNQVNQFDTNGTNIFTKEGYEVEKLMILLADIYRQSIRYPMDKARTSTVEFIRAYYSDHVVHTVRSINPKQVDLGNFSRNDFSPELLTNKTVNLTSKPNFRSAGVYAFAGKSFTVTRLDNSPTTISIFINSLREKSTQEFKVDGYNRPKFLRSQKVPLLVGETLTLTNPYGGPVQVGFDEIGFDVQLEFNQIGLHPYWESSEDTETFNQALNNDNFDWVEIITSQFEIHSTVENILKTFDDDNSPDIETLASNTEIYMHNFPHVLAGFQGPNIDVVAEIHDFADDQGYNINELDLVKHINSDQASCGGGCGGNPIDTNWEFNPLSHGDLHEFGHGLEKNRLRFEGWAGHASTNPYVYYSKSQFYKNTGIEPDCSNLPFDKLLETLQTSRKDANPFGYMVKADLNGWAQGVSITIQMMMAAQAQGALQDGWNLLPRLQIYEREYSRSLKNDDIWLETRENFGLGSYTRVEAKKISNNDWLINGISYVTGLDYRDFFTMWGLGFSDTVGQQIAQHGLERVELNFYQANGGDYCYGLDKPALTIAP